MYKLPCNIKRVCVYIRKSREDIEAEARGEDTLSRQRELMVKDVLPRYSVDDYDLFEEVVSGDSIEARPEFQKVIDALRLGSYQAIACKDLSRLGRGKYSDMGIVYDLIQDRNILIITTTGILDPRNYNDLRMIRFSLFFNREEYEQTVWRLTQGKYDAAKAGKYIAGSVPYGMEYNPKTQVLIPKESEAEIVRMIFHWFANEGLGYRAISTRLKKQGIPSPRGNELWQPEVIHRMLEKPAYNGTLAFRLTQRNKSDGKVVKRPEDEHIIVEDAWEPLIDEVTWQKVQRRLDKKLHKPPVKVDFSPCELAGIITHECGKKMIRQSSIQRYKRNDGEISLYQKEFMYCQYCSQAIKYRDCENQLLTVLSEMATLSTPILHAKINEMLTLSNKKYDIDHQEIINRLQEKKESISRKLTRARDFLLDGTFSKSEYEDAKRDYQAEMIEIDKSIEYSKTQLSILNNTIVDVNVDEIRTNIHSVLQAYERIEDKSEKNELLRAFFEIVVVKNVKRGTGRIPATFDLDILIRPELLV